MWFVEEIKRNFSLEFDFFYEGRNCERVERFFKYFSFLKVFKIYWDLFLERVLIMEFCEGGKVDDKVYMEKYGINVNEVIELIKVYEKKMDGGYMYFVVYCFRRGENFYSICNINKW